MDEGRKKGSRRSRKKEIKRIKKSSGGGRKEGIRKIVKISREKG